MTTTLIRRTALGVAGLAAVAATSVTLVATAGAHDVSIPELPIPPHIYYGAIAYAPTGEVGIARRKVSSALAEMTALRECGASSCTVLSSFTRCGAVAYDGATFQGATGYTRAAAEQAAINSLGGGRIVNWACNHP